MVAALVAGAAAPGLPAAAPASDSATSQGVTGVIGALLGTCLVSRERGVMIADLSAADRGDLRPATPSERTAVADKAAPAWTTAALGSRLVIYEPSKDRCDVVADGLSAETPGQTCVIAALLAQHLPTPLTLQPTNLAHEPVVCQLEGVSGGQRFVVRLEGRPGASAGLSRLQASVVRESAYAKSPSH